MELQRVGYDLATKQQQYVKQVTDETILDSTRNPTQCSVVAQMGMKSKKGDIYIYMAEKETQKGKTAVWGGLTNSWEKRVVKGQGEKERFIHLNA